MNKILTISIAAYQVAAYIRQTLDSIVLPEIIDELEIFVVDDGGRDESLSIAQEYEKKFPDSVHAVHKENGGYGSTVNYSVAHSTGKFFKLLDGDDWFDRDGLLHLVEVLRTTDADMIATPFRSGADEKNLKLMERSWSKYYGQTLKIQDIVNEQIPMWCITYKTSCLKAAELQLPEHKLYTDYIYDVIPFQYVKTLLFDSSPVYCYRIGRDGQSMSVESRVKHIQDAIDIALELCDFYNREAIQHSNDCRQYILYRCAGACRFALIGLLLLTPCEENRRKAIEFDSCLKKKNQEIYNAIGRVGKFGVVLRLLRLTRYHGVNIVYKYIPN